MRKIIFGLSGILIAAFVVIMFTNAQNNTQVTNKPASEISADCAKCPSAAACTTMADTKTTEVVKCDPAKCKEGKCDPATCKATCANANGAVKACNPAMCSGMAKK